MVEAPTSSLVDPVVGPASGRTDLGSTERLREMATAIALPRTQSPERFRLIIHSDMAVSTVIADNISSGVPAGPARTSAMIPQDLDSLECLLDEM